jgi:DNA primase
LRIPPEKIDEVRNAIDIIDLIGAFVKLKKRGKNFIGLCPFHSEKTPSFNVSADRQMYHCFGCGVGGNVFTFVMEYEKVSFAEAVRSLAEKAGISVPSDTRNEEIVASEQEQLYQVCRTAGLFFYNCLTDTAEGKLALEYFHHRGFTDETIRTFGLGYAPNSWDALIKHAEENKFSIDLLEKAGLVRKREDGTHYDYFRGRAMFPIFSVSGRVIGFGARKLREDDPLGKYINSPETSIYNKSRVLYGLFQSKESLREYDNAILVEGYADLITSYQAGVKNIVASSGTSLTQEQIQLIGRYTKNITIVYDADSAGSQAALRGVDLILEQDMDVRVVALPKGDDPDSFVKKNGGGVFRSLIDGALSFVDFLAQTFETRVKHDTPEGQTEMVRLIVQTIAKMGDELKRNFYIKHVAEKYKLYETTLYRELEKYRGEDRQQKRIQIASLPTATIPQNRDTVTLRSTDEVPIAERDLIQAMLTGSTEIVRFICQNLQIEDITHRLSRVIISQLFDLEEEGKEINLPELLDQFEDQDQKGFISTLLISRDQPSGRWKEFGAVFEPATAWRMAIDALLKIKRTAFSKLIESNWNRQREAGQRGEDTTPFVEQHIQLQNLMSREVKELELKLEGISANLQNRNNENNDER